MLAPEPPYPLHGGGAYRSASLLHYLAQFSRPDLILISESGKPALLPEGLVGNQYVVPLPHHSKALLERYRRNASRAVRGVPPLIDRLSGLESEIGRLIEGQHYDLGIIEHFWCAPYVDLLAEVCGKVVLDLHNVESVLHQRCASFSRGVVAMGHRRFAEASRRLESLLLPRFDTVLAASEADAQRVRTLAPTAHVQVYPNAFPLVPVSCQTERGQEVLVFSGNFEYHPNIDAVRFLTEEIWPEVRRRHPQLRLRLVGRGNGSIRHLLGSELGGIEVTGPVDDAFSEIAEATIVIAPLRIGSGTRLKIIEGWAAGRPVVATVLAAEGLDARDGENIRLAGGQEADASSFVAAIDQLLSDPALRICLGAAGRATYETSYSWNAAWATLRLDAQLMQASGLNRYTGNN
jgi:glycosyltransferase involved in cell wall biosynthesis